MIFGRGFTAKDAKIAKDAKEEKVGSFELLFLGALGVLCVLGGKNSVPHLLATQKRATPAETMK